MEKNNIDNLMNDFLNKSFSETYLRDFTAKGPKKFFNAINRLDERQINKVLVLHPEFTNQSHDGWHALHYAVLTNNQHIVDKFIKTSIAQGLRYFPNTEKLKKDIVAGTSLLSFCVQNNCEKSFAKTLTYTADSHETDYGSLIRLSIIHNSFRLLPLLESIVGKETMQKSLASMLLYEEIVDEKILRSNMRWIITKIKFDPAKLEDYGVDIKYTEENSRNYFTAYVQALLDVALIKTSYGDHEYHNDFDRMKLTQYLEFFFDKGFSLDTPDKTGESARKNFDKIKKIFEENHGTTSMQKIWVDLEKKSLENSIAQNSVPQVKKLKL